MYINKALIYGNLTRDPELKALPSGSSVCSFSVATNRVWKDKNGAKQESTDYHNIVTFGRQAEIVAQYLKKGSGVFVDGRIQTRSWEGKDGTKQYRTEIVADNIQFGPRAGGSAPAADAPHAGPRPQASKPSAKEELDTIQYPDEEVNLNDIPF
ncbi:MAG TPA: single-stranded DNA-binding protein [Candidatus Paceibacterota bacterium]|nr:single-stranded DNA-binding protein [Candidatus Paceibacterota bacterium]